MPRNSEPLLIGLDLNATRARAVAGVGGDLPQPWPLEGRQSELPMALSLEKRTPEAGRAGVALCRRLPHLACCNFLPHLDGTRRWGAGSQGLDANRAAAVALEQLRAACGQAGGVTLVVPAYLHVGQIGSLTDLADRAGLPVLGSVAAPLAAALAAHAEDAWSGTALVADVDDHALTWATVTAQDGQAWVSAIQVTPHLGLATWKERLLDTLADRCVRQTRRDPRDSAVAEQSLYEQLETALDACCHGRLAELAIKTPQWYQNLILRPEELAAFCTSLVRQTLDALRVIRAEMLPEEPAVPILVTGAVGRLPGLVRALEEWAGPAAAGGPAAHPVHVLSPDAPARAAVALALRVARGSLPHGHLDAAPLPPPQPVDAGPARLQFRGQDYYLPPPSAPSLLGGLAARTAFTEQLSMGGAGPTFTLGRHSACDLVFDPELYPAVAARHCEIVCECRRYVLRDRSSQGTLVNDRPVRQPLTLEPGDWIRLGPQGPVLRFLGQASEQQKLVTTA
jgi:FHA domain/Hsp70 protein